MEKSAEIDYNITSYRLQFDKIYQEHFGRLYFYATTLTKCEEMAKDVVSEVFVNFWKSKSNIDKIRDIESYLFISVKNQAIQTISKKSNDNISIETEHLIKEIDKTNPEEVLIEKELLNALEEAIFSLPDQCQLVFKLARDKNMTYQEIANELGIAPSTVKSHMIKAISDIRIFVSARYNDSNTSKLIGALVITLLSLDQLGINFETGEGFIL